MTLSLVFLARSSTFLTLCRSLGLPSPVLPPANSSCLSFPGLPAPSLPSWGPLSLPGPLPALQLEMLWEVSWASQGLPLHHMIPSVLKVGHGFLDLIRLVTCLPVGGQTQPLMVPHLQTRLRRGAQMAPTRVSVARGLGLLVGGRARGLCAC